MRGPSFDDTPPNLSEELKKKFHAALDGKLDLRTCRDCVSARGFVQVMDFVIEQLTDAAGRMDIASQRMEDMIELVKQIEEKEMKARMNGEDGR